MTNNNINPRTGEAVKEGDLRVYFMINMNRHMCHNYVESPEEAIRVINYEANRQLEAEHIHDNVFGLEVFEDGDWSEWYSEIGDDIMTTMDEMEEEE